MVGGGGGRLLCLGKDCRIWEYARGWSFIPRIQPWSSIQSAIPGRNVPTLNAVVTSGMSSARGETGGGVGTEAPS
ncbi:unnamed protein product [Sphagnum jensenii]